jgi:predicted ribonuclease YlaK
MSSNGHTKSFVVDTNVLLHNPNALFMFADNEVIIPFDVIEELDKFKAGTDDLGRNARTVIRTSTGCANRQLSEGVPSADGRQRARRAGGRPAALRRAYRQHADNRIICCAKEPPPGKRSCSSRRTSTPGSRATRWASRRFEPRRSISTPYTGYAS